MNYLNRYDATPDFNRLLTVLRRTGEPDRVPFIELFADLEIMEAVLDRPFPRLGDYRPDAPDRKAEAHYCDLLIEFYHRSGYDYVRAAPRGGDFDYGFLQLADTESDLSKGKRSWARESGGVITNWADFEAYPWPKAEEIDYWTADYTAQRLPDGMKLIGHGASILEPLMWLMGYETFALALYDQPDLIETMFQLVGEHQLARCKALCEIDNMGAIWISDDIGFRSGTMIAPDHLRQYVFPWWKRIATHIHERGMPVLLHSCGNLVDVMDDIIDDVGIDGKHSYEDTFLPVTEAKRQYGHRLAILGGIDLDFLCRSSEREVRARVRDVIDICGAGGGYALGTGNSVANYIPLRNYLAMLDEGRSYGVYG
jgi:uroporphyrinogen decarboxylase